MKPAWPRANPRKCGSIDRAICAPLSGFHFPRVRRIQRPRSTAQWPFQQIGSWGSGFCVFSFRCRRYGIIGRFAPRVAPANAADGHPASAPRAVYFNAFLGISRTRRLESTIGSEQRTQRDLVDANQEQHHGTNHEGNLQRARTHSRRPLPNFKKANALPPSGTPPFPLRRRRKPAVRAPSLQPHVPRRPVPSTPRVSAIAPLPPPS